MKNFQQNLLITLALALCGLCAWQWYFQNVQRARLEEDTHGIYQRDTAIQGYTNSMQAMDHQVAQMDQRITELKQTVASNAEFTITQERALARATASNDTLNGEITQYKDAVSSLTNKLETAYSGITKQNKAVQELVAQRDEFVQKYTNLVTEFNKLTVEYSNVVVRLNALQSAAAGPTAK